MGVTHRHRDDAYFSRISSGTNNEGLVLIHGYW